MKHLTWKKTKKNFGNATNPPRETHFHEKRSGQADRPKEKKSKEKKKELRKWSIT